MNDTSLNLGIIISEPVTAATDLLLAWFCIYSFLKLKLPSESKPLLKFWRLFFLFLGISTAFGGLLHGLKLYINADIYKGIRIGMNLCSIVSSYFLLLASAEMLDNGNASRKKKVRIFVQITTILISAITIANNEFSLIVIYAGVVVLLTIILNYLDFKKGEPGAQDVALGFGISLFSIIVFKLHISIHEYFNFNDISHIIMLISLYYVFLGAMAKTRLEEFAGEGSEI